jgi:hypothetical protein
MIPERELWGAVLMQAIYDTVGLHVATSARDRRLIRQQAESWFLFHSSSLGSFLWVCNSLNLDPASVRRRALSLSPVQLRARIQMPINRKVFPVYTALSSKISEATSILNPVLIASSMFLSFPRS